MKRVLSPEEKADAAELASMWQSSKFRNATVEVFVRDETDHEGRPTYEFVIRGVGRLPKLSPAVSPAASARSPENSIRETTG
jgi:hypothetical protein